MSAERVVDAVKDVPSFGSAKMVALAAGLSVGVTVGYMVYRHISSSSNDCDDEDTGAQVTKMMFPLEVYRNMSRYQNRLLETVNQNSGAEVWVQSDAATVCFLLQGSEEQILRARCVLETLASDSEPLTEILEVPQTAFGRIIGRGGESLKLITRTAGAKVVCSKERSNGPGAKGNITVTGTKQEVTLAKEMIQEKVTEDMMVRARISQSSALRQKRGSCAESQRTSCTETQTPAGLNNNRPPQSEENGHIHRAAAELQREKIKELHISGLDQNLEEEEKSQSSSPPSEISKFEIPSPDLSFQPDEHLEVYVSASENPNHFWIQILGVRSLQLDKLNEEMNRFYSSGNLEDQEVESIVVGDIVAAPYRDHGTWNRARVLGALASGLVDLYYVDFGDNGEVPRDCLRRMRSDFLSLPFQAIECSLAGVQPIGDKWTEEALDDFEQLTHCASWRPLQARLCSYSHSESSSWPSVRLFVSRENKTVDVGEEMIRRGHALAHQEAVKEKMEMDHVGSLQRMLDDVIGASSELSLSCISLSDVASISGSVDDVIEDELI